MQNILFFIKNCYYIKKLSLCQTWLLSAAFQDHSYCKSDV